MDKLTQSISGSIKFILQAHEQSLDKLASDFDKLGIVEHKIGSVFEKITSKIQNSLKLSLDKITEHFGQLSPTQQNSVTAILNEQINNVIQQSVCKTGQKIQSSFTALFDDFGRWSIEEQKSVGISQQTERPKVTQRHLNSSLAQLKTNRTSRLLLIEEEKQSIIKQIRGLDEEIMELKGERIVSSLSKRRESQIQMEKAVEQAKKLISHYKHEKRIKEQQRRLKTEKLLSEMAKEEEERRVQRQKRQKVRRQQKRRAISIRIEDVKQKRKERISIDKQSNKLVAQLKKEEEYLKKQQELPEQLKQLELKIAERSHIKESINMRQIVDHERRYISDKYHQKLQNHQHRNSGVHQPAYKYEKNVWASILEEEEKKRKDQQKIKQLKPQINLERRMKYSQLVKNIFSKPKGKNSRRSTSTQKLDKPKTPEHSELSRLPAISESEKRINQFQLVKKTRESKRIATSPGHSMVFKTKAERQQKSPQQKQIDQQRQKRLNQLKKQTEERLKKLDNYQLQKEKGEKPRYKNYLGKVKLKRRSDPKSWKKILENSSLTQAEVCEQMMRKVTELEEKAKRKERSHTQLEDQQSIDLYIDSIQAKLAMLQNL